MNNTTSSKTPRYSIKNHMNNPSVFYKMLFTLLLIFVFTLSFQIYAPINFKFLNSDQGMHALMAANFDFKHGFYYWGQNRLGSILPLLASFLIKINISPLWAVSLVQYAFLLGLYILLFKLINNYVLKLSAAVFLFLPIVTHIELLNIGHPYAPQLFLSVLLFYLSKLISSHFSLKNILIISLFWIISLLDIWVSEISFIVIFIIVCFTLIFLSNNQKSTKDKILHLIRTPFFLLLPVSLLGIFYIYSKIKIHFKDPIFEAYGINSIDKTYEAFTTHFERLYHTISFSNNFLNINAFTVLCVLVFIYLVIINIYQHKKHILNKIISKNYFIFFTISIATFSAINFTQWAGIENYPHRYYVFSYISFITGLLLCVDDLTLNKKNHFILFITLFTSIIGGLSYIKLDKEQTRFKIDKEAYKTLTSLNQSTFIGNYWFTYVMGSYNAAKITSIVPDQSYIRNPHQLDKAFENAEVFLIKNNWLKSFPDTILQYGNMLIKNKFKTDIIIGNATVHQYINEDLLIEKDILKELRDKILENKQQVDLIHKKAKLNHVTFDDVLEKDLLILLKKEKKIRTLENSIRRNNNWMLLILEKAKKRKVSIEEMIRLDAEYMVNQNNNQ